MEATNVDHILNHNKVIRDFNISKRMNPIEMESIKTLVERVCDDKRKAAKLFQKELMKYTAAYMQSHRIPGIINKNPDGTFVWNKKTSSPNESSTGNPNISNGIKQIEIKSDKYKQIQRDAICLSNFLTNNKKFTTQQLIFFIISLVDATGIEQEEFGEFYKNIGESGELDESDADDEIEEN